VFIPRTAHRTTLLDVQPFLEKNSSTTPAPTAGALWPRLTPVISIWHHYQTYMLAGYQVSPGKNVDFPCSLAAFTPSIP
jgi:hypothetical protein